MKYKCNLCEEVFEDPLIKTEKRPDFDGFSETLRYILCPCCGDGDFSEYEEDDE